MMPPKPPATDLGTASTRQSRTRRRSRTPPTTQRDQAGTAAASSISASSSSTTSSLTADHRGPPAVVVSVRGIAGARPSSRQVGWLDDGVLLTIDERGAFLLRRDLVVSPGGGYFRAPTSSREAVNGLWSLMLWVVYVQVEARALQSQRGCLTGIRHIRCHASKGVATCLSTSLPIIPEDT